MPRKCICKACVVFRVFLLLLFLGRGRVFISLRNIHFIFIQLETMKNNQDPYLKLSQNLEFENNNCEYINTI